MKTTKRGRGRPPKAPGGLTAVLFVRVTPQMRAALRARARVWSRTRGRPVAIADVVRESLASDLREVEGP